MDLIYSCCGLKLLLHIVLLWILKHSMSPAQLLNEVGANMLLHYKVARGWIEDGTKPEEVGHG